jgi:hypothetical protein
MLAHHIRVDGCEQALKCRQQLLVNIFNMNFFLVTFRFFRLLGPESDFLLWYFDRLLSPFEQGFLVLSFFQFKKFEHPQSPLNRMHVFF